MRTMPENTIIPVLAYPDIGKAVHWLTATLDFTVRWRIENHRAQLSFGNCTIAVTEGHTNAASLILQVKGIDRYFEKTQAQGVRIVTPPTNYFYGERQYTLEDIGGHFWTLSETIKELTPEDWGANAYA